MWNIAAQYCLVCSKTQGEEEKLQHKANAFNAMHSAFDIYTNWMENEILEYKSWENLVLLMKDFEGVCFECQNGEAKLYELIKKHLIDPGIEARKKIEREDVITKMKGKKVVNLSMIRKGKSSQ